MTIIEKIADLPIPPESLRHRVHGASDVDSFLSVGKECSKSLIFALEKIGESIERFESILDFGCGSGRVLRWMLPLLSEKRVFGADIDYDAIRWCAHNIPQVSFAIMPEQPPTGFATQSFDLIYAISVFSHLNEAHQFHWLAELQRITRPGAIVLLSIHGSFYLNNLSPETKKEIDQTGFSFVVSGGWKGIFPNWYQVAFHTREYVEQYYSNFFELIDYIDLGMNGVQDLVVLRRRDETYSEIQKNLSHSLAMHIKDEDSWMMTNLNQQNRIYELESKVRLLERFLEQQVNIKNQHIAMLEDLIKQINQGRMMRLLNSLRRIAD